MSKTETAALKWRWFHALRTNPPKDPRWTGSVAATALAMWGMADADGSSIYPSRETLAAMIGSTARTISRNRAVLEELNLFLVTRPQAGRSAQHYALAEPATWKYRPDEPEAEATPKVEPIPKVESIPKVEPERSPAPIRRTLPAVRGTFDKANRPHVPAAGKGIPER